MTTLTSDHRWTSEAERARLAGMGIQLEGRTRLYGLNLSRCLGDNFLKARYFNDPFRNMSLPPVSWQLVRQSRAFRTSCLTCSAQHSLGCSHC